MTNRRLIQCGLVLALFGCGGGDDTAPSARKAAAPNTQIPLASAPATAIAGASPVLGSAGKGADSPAQPLLPAASHTDTGRLDGCTAGVYKGDYDIGFLGMGPITFTLVASEPSTSSVPCQEFCPELVVSSDGGKFSASLADIFAGSAKLKGGLDCRTGEFRVEMVEGQYSFGAENDPSALMLGDLTGQFTGRFAAGAPAGISGDIKCNVGVEIEGTFKVARVP